MRHFLLSITLAFFICVKAQVNSFSINFNGSTPTGFTLAVTTAIQKWSAYLQMPVPVKINVFTVNSGLLPFSAITLANGRQNFVNAPVANFIYPTALANQLAGVETNPGEYDMDIYFNLATNYYFGSGKPSGAQTDMISTAMHEIGHGLGFYSDGYVDNGGIGSFGNIPSSSIFPLMPSFPWPGQSGVPGIFDKYIIRMSNSSLIAVAPNNTAALGDSIKNGAVYFSGPLYANPSHSNLPVRLSGGTGSFTLGVDLLHIHNTYANTIMSYYWGSGDTVRIPAPWELGILKEIGWNLKVIGIHENNKLTISSIYPSPANASVFISAKNISEVNVYNLQGQLIHTKINALKEDEVTIETQNLKDGIYFFLIKFFDSEVPVVKKIVVKH